MTPTTTAEFADADLFVVGQFDFEEARHEVVYDGPAAATMSPATVPRTVVNAIAEIQAKSNSPKLLANSGAACSNWSRQASRRSSPPGR